jgi:hypothetical protein
VDQRAVADDAIDEARNVPSSEGAIGDRVEPADDLVEA